MNTATNNLIANLPCFSIEASANIAHVDCTTSNGDFVLKVHARDEVAAKTLVRQYLCRKVEDAFSRIQSLSFTQVRRLV
jgi:hypothetical protein